MIGQVATTLRRIKLRGTRHSAAAVAQVLAICRVLPKLESGGLDVSSFFNNTSAEAP
jgi:hypothetical protein